MSVKQEQEQRREIIRRAKELQEREIEEEEEEQWEEAVRQVLEEAEGLPGQKQEKMQCKKCGKERIVMNRQNRERECEEIGRKCAELTDAGIRADHIRKLNKRITHKNKDRLSEYIESWRRELIRYADGRLWSLNEAYQKNRKETKLQR